MKQAVWLMILAISFWSLDRDQWVSSALGAATTVTNVNTNIQTVVTTRTIANGQVIVTTEYRTTTTTNISTITGSNTETGLTTNTNTGSSTDTNCHGASNLYGGAGSWAACNRAKNNNQDNTQDDTKDLNNQGANKSTALGMAAIAAGMAMVAAGMALLPSPPTTPIGVALIAAGMALIAAGMAALAAAGKMNNNANKAATNAFKMDNLSPYKSTITEGNGTGTSALDPVKVDVGEGGSTGIKIDPALLRQGKMDGIYGDLEKKTGLNRDEFADAMANGANPLALLSNSPALRGKASASEGNLQKMMDDTLAKGNLPNGEEMMNQLGLTADDLGKGNVVDLGAGGSRTPAAASQPNLDTLFPGAGDTKAGASGGDFMKISPEVQAALDKNGIVHGRTIFEMVHLQYKKKTPQMFGVQERKIDGTANNPYSSLNGDKMEL